MLWPTLDQEALATLWLALEDAEFEDAALKAERAEEEVDLSDWDDANEAAVIEEELDMVEASKSPLVARSPA